MKKHLKKAFSWVGNYLLHFTQTQLAITLVAIPILIGWGLGYSWMSCIGNLIFTPVLVLFLLLSSLLFFTQLLGIPNNLIATFLNYVTHTWHRVLELGSPSWLIECTKPPTLILISIPIIAFIILHRPFFNTHIKRCLVLISLLILTFGICKFYQHRNTNTSLTYQLNEKLYVIRLANTNAIILIDQGYFSQKKSIEKVINYEVKPWIVKHLGSVSIRELRILKPSMGSFKAAQYMCTLLHVDAVWLPFFKKTLSKTAWHAFFDLKRCVEEKKIRFVRYSTVTALAKLRGLSIG